MSDDPDDIPTVDLNPTASARRSGWKPPPPEELAAYTPAMLAILLRRAEHGGFANWWPVRGEDGAVGYAAGMGAAFVRAEDVIEIILREGEGDS